MKTTNVIKINKMQLRKHYLTLLKTLPNTKKQQWDKNIFINFKQFVASNQNIKLFALYCSLDHEVNTKILIEWLWKQKKLVCLPRMEAQNLVFYLVNSPHYSVGELLLW